MASGSIRKRVRKDGIRYEAVVDFGLDPATGKRVQRSKAFKTRREAREYLAASLVEADKGTFVDRSRQTVAGMMQYWLDTHARPRLRAKTVFDYENTIRNHILPELGTVLIQKLTADRLLTFYTDKLAAGVGPRTIRLCHLHLRQALDQAERLGLVPRNVAALVSPPKSQPKEMKVWTAEQAQAFLSVADQSIYGPIWIVALVTGMRKGELLGLRWQDIDFETGVLHVRQTVGALHGKIEYKKPKTAKSRRDIDLDDGILAVLRAYKLRQLERRLELGPRWQDYDLVFPSNVGTATNPDNCDSDFNRLVKLAGVKRIRIHDTRHSYATLAILSGIPINVVSQSMGHGDVSTTLRTYAHVMPEQRRELARKMGSLLLPSNTTAVG